MCSQTSLAQFSLKRRQFFARFCCLNNAGKNGILLVTLPEDQVQTLLERARSRDGYKLTVSLQEDTIRDAEGFKTTVAIDPFRRNCLLEGLDDIGLTLRHAAERF
jgi:3-isopropylmalate/(R)-2-methylmalate dehydratase small subunit